MSFGTILEHLVKEFDESKSKTGKMEPRNCIAVLVETKYSGGARAFSIFLLKQRSGERGGWGLLMLKCNEKNNLA